MTTPTTFEENLAELDRVVGALERGELPLAEALTAYQTGMALVQACQKQLETVQVQLEKINAEQAAALAGNHP